MFDGFHGYAYRGRVGCGVAACPCHPLSTMLSLYVFHYMLVLFACLFVDEL